MTMTNTRLCRTGMLALVLTGGTAWAQDSKQPPPNSDVSRPGSLSTKLNDTNGVIHPEGPTDPAIQKTPPAVGTMPVLRPPGSPGGPEGAVPK